MPPFDYHARLGRLRALLDEEGLDAVLLSVGRDLLYFTGYEAMPLERLTMAVIGREGPAVVVVPELEAPRMVMQDDAFEVQSWAETEDPIGIVADLVGDPNALALGDETWSVFLLRLQECLPRTAFCPASPLTARLRIRKSPEEIDRLRSAAAAADRVALRLHDERFSGRSERDLAEMVGAWTVEEGHEVRGFAIVAGGVNAASPHHEPGTRQIRRGDGVVVDFGGRIDGYFSDTTRTFHVGPPADDFMAAYRVLEDAQRRAAQAVRPGVTAASIDRVAREAITEAGFGPYFIHRTGHGIGLDAHEQPYLVEGNDTVLQPGMAFSVEPGIYFPDRFGMRIEDIVVVAEDGVEVLNRSPRSLVVVD